MARKRFVRWPVLAVAALVFAMTGALAQAAVTPAEFSATLAPGESVDVDKLVDVPETPEKVDIYFLADTTGSMSTVINQVKADASTVLGTLSGAIVDVQFGAGDYKDFPSDPYAFNPVAPIGPDDGVGGSPDASDAINGWFAGGGNDGSEGQFYALDQIASNPAIGWRPDAQRIVVWFGDAPGHDPVCSAISGLAYDIDEASLTAKLTSANIAVVAISTTTGYPNGLDDDPTTSASNYGPFCVIGGASGQATRISGATGGAYLAGVAPADIATAILDGISEVTVDVTADASACSPLVVTYDPAVHEDVVGPDTVAFVETIAVPDGTPTGTYTCTVLFTASGAVIGRQTITIDVTGDDVPPTAACVETNNPSGKNIPTAGPSAGNSGQNPDGFYLISASDEESGVASIELIDSVSGFSVSLSDGDTIKLTQAPGVEPNVKPGAGDVTWKIQFQGDAVLVVTDNEGNATRTLCLVPPPAK